MKWGNIYKASLLAWAVFVAAPISAQAEGPIRELLKKRIEQRQAKEFATDKSTEGLYTHGANYQGKVPNDSFGGRDMSIYVPSRLPAAGQRAMIVVLHGGMGNANQIQNYIGLDVFADRYGFIVAYLNGAPASRSGMEKMHAWNAGECCGQPQAKNIDDVAYVSDAISYLAKKYGINPARVFGAGHSNGAMMTLRLVCETNLYAAAVPISGPLEIDVKSCPAAKGKHILALHGADDLNVPLEGGNGSKGITNVDFNSQAYTRDVFTKSGATYQLDVVPGADHSPQTINAALLKTEGVSLPQKIIQYFGLDHTQR